MNDVGDNNSEFGETFDTTELGYKGDSLMAGNFPETDNAPSMETQVQWLLKLFDIQKLGSDELNFNTLMLCFKLLDRILANITPRIEGRVEKNIKENCFITIRQAKQMHHRLSILQYNAQRRDIKTWNFPKESFEILDNYEIAIRTLIDSILVKK